MKKHPSTTTETRMTQSDIFKKSMPSSLNPSQSPLQSMNNFYMSNNINKCENRELEFIRVRNLQLEEKNARLIKHLAEVEKSNKDVLAINAQYVSVVNAYYQDRNSESPSKGKGQVQKVLQGLEKDHRNLVKHCLAMESEIKNYKGEMEKFEAMKFQLQAVNQTSVTDLCSEIQDLATENKYLRQVYNKLGLDYQKSMEELKKIQKIRIQQEQDCESNGGEMSKLQCLFNTVKQESEDKSAGYESRIYGLELKVERLEGELRSAQMELCKKEKRSWSRVSDSFVRERTFSLEARSRGNSNVGKEELNMSINSAINKQNVNKNPIRSIIGKNKTLLFV